MSNDFLFDELPHQKAPSLVEQRPEIFGDKRPTRYHLLVLEDAARRIAPKIIEWNAGDGDDTDNIVEHLIAVSKLGSHDGYEMANSLDHKFYYQPDSDLVEILEEFAGHIADSERRATRAWVKYFDKKAKFEKDQVVTFTGYDDSGKRRQMNGEVIHVDADRLCYTIRVDELGHVKRGPGTLGFSILEEDIQGLAA